MSTLDKKEKLTRSIQEEEDIINNKGLHIVKKPSSSNKKLIIREIRNNIKKEFSVLSGEYNLIIPTSEKILTYYYYNSTKLSFEEIGDRAIKHVSGDTYDKYANKYRDIYNKGTWSISDRHNSADKAVLTINYDKYRITYNLYSQLPELLKEKNDITEEECVKFLWIHLERLFGDRQSAEYYLDHLAIHIRGYARKLSDTGRVSDIIIQGDAATGKNKQILLLTKALAAVACVDDSDLDVHAKGNTHLFDNNILIFNENESVGSRFDHATIKRWTDSIYWPHRAMYAQKNPLRRRFGISIRFTNKITLNMDESIRRKFTWFQSGDSTTDKNGQPLNKKFSERFDTVLRSSMAAKIFRKMIFERRVSHFKLLPNLGGHAVGGYGISNIRGAHEPLAFELYRIANGKTNLGNGSIFTVGKKDLEEYISEKDIRFGYLSQDIQKILDKNDDIKININKHEGRREVVSYTFYKPQNKYNIISVEILPEIMQSIKNKNIDNDPF